MAGNLSKATFVSEGTMLLLSSHKFSDVNGLTFNFRDTFYNTLFNNVKLRIVFFEYLLSFVEESHI